MKDYLKKEPSKNDRAIYEIALHLQHLDRSLISNSAHMVALGILLDVKPEKIAELLVNSNEKIQEYGKAINEAIDKLEKEKHPQGEAHSHTHEGEVEEAK